jgi:hypothetical protein
MKLRDRHNYNRLEVRHHPLARREERPFACAKLQLPAIANRPLSREV